MTEEQKRFKILKRTSYEEQISKENRVAIRKTFLFGLLAAGAIGILSKGTQQIDATTRLVDVGIGFTDTIFSVYQLNGLMQAIGKKIMLQGKIEDINTELEEPESEESRGIKRW